MGRTVRLKSGTWLSDLRAGVSAKMLEWKLGVVLPIMGSCGAKADRMLPDIHGAIKDRLQMQLAV